MENRSVNLNYCQLNAHYNIYPVNYLEHIWLILSKRQFYCRKKRYTCINTSVLFLLFHKNKNIQILIRCVQTKRA